ARHPPAGLRTRRRTGRAAPGLEGLAAVAVHGRADRCGSALPPVRAGRVRSHSDPRADHRRFRRGVGGDGHDLLRLPDRPGAPGRAGPGRQRAHPDRRGR
ncbi:MAG: ABC transporter, substrate-binding protein (cluster 9, phospholipid), partial [uncultured Ramlibacter sp.]